ncbi:MAG: 2-dehydropantoate 2-reductase [Candidatus Omnitrophica bacterium]|nr:2-dehydropantoate 2-reductase [Candidatus Omnitrophota bacterium]
MKIAVIGSGAIGGLVAAYLKIKGQGVSVVALPDTVNKVRETGLKISGIRGDFSVAIDISEKLDFCPDLAIFATKTQDIESAVRRNHEFLQDSVILTTQNGLQAEKIVARFVPAENIISSIVMFGSTYLEPGKIVHNFEGSWIIGSAFGINNAKVIEVSSVLNQIFPVIVAEDIKGMKYLKVFVNANNCIPAILGTSMQEAFSDLEVSKISMAIWKEAFDIVSRSGIKLESLPDFPLERLTKLTSMPLEESAKIYSGIMLGLSKEPFYGSILQSIKRGKASEIDYINGEFVNLAKANNLGALLNEKLISLVHQVERTGKFFTKEELFKELMSLR